MYRFFLTLIVLLMTLTACNCLKMNNYSHKTNLIKQKFNLNRKELKQIIKNDSIILELIKFEGVNDSIKIYHAKRRLDSFFARKYSKEMLIVTLQMERLLRTKSNNFEISKDSNNPSNINFENVDQIKAFLKKLEKRVMINNSMKVKDSINNRKD